MSDVNLQIVGKVPHLVSQLRTEKSSNEFLLRFAELMHCLMQLHPGYPDLYEPVLEALKVKGHFVFCLVTYLIFHSTVLILPKKCNVH